MGHKGSTRSNFFLNEPIGHFCGNIIITKHTPNFHEIGSQINKQKHIQLRKTIHELEYWNLGSWTKTK
jgi:hypothetical protein